MTDTTNSTDDPQTPTTGDKADPLAVLENILKEAQQKQANGGAGDAPQAAGPDEPQVETQPAGPTEAEKVQIQADEAAHQLEVKAEQVKMIEVQRQQIAQEVMTSPQYQAKISQEKNAQQDQVTKMVAGEGFDIKQLGHEKIDLPTKD